VVADVPRSKPSVVIATFQPSLTPPTTLATGQWASVKKTSQNSPPPSGCTMRRGSTPGWFIGHNRYEMPLCLDASGSVRHRMKI